MEDLPRLGRQEIVRHAIDLVIPVHDEAPFIGAVLRRVPAIVRTVWVVDDGSTDGTGELVAREFPDVALLRHPVNRGVGASVVRGYRAALEAGADVVVTLDGDGQLDPAELPAVVAPILQGRADYVKGDRISANGHGGAMPPARRLANGALATITRFAGGTPRLPDTQCGYAAATAALLRRLDLGRIAPRYGYVNDIIFEVTRKRGRIETVPVRVTYGAERSDIRPWPTCVDFSGIFLRGLVCRLLAL
jgi:glycosyltransferase involved in cell wall biosynthesis